MIRQNQPATRIARPRRPMAGAFTFTEVLFAVMLLGIGFIMVAAMFPVAIRQTQTTMDETITAALARTAVRTMEMQAMSAGEKFVQTSASAGQAGRVQPLSPAPAGSSWTWHSGPDSEALWDKVRGSMILPTDPRYAWVPLYRRGMRKDGSWDGFAELIIIMVQNRNGDIYRLDATRDDTEPQEAEFPAQLAPKLVEVKLTNNTDASQLADTIQFRSPGGNLLGGTVDLIDAVAEGTYVVIADAGGDMNGRIYRVGTRKTGTPEPDTWYLMPGEDMVSDAENSTNWVRAFIVGRGYADPTKPAKGFEGPAQDIAAYRTYIRIN